MPSNLGIMASGASGGFVPSSIPTLVAWYDASDLASITASAGAVSQWNDKSGNGYHWVQGTGANQPTTGTRTQNGLNVLDFDGVNGFMTNSPASQSQPNTVFCVIKSDTVASTKCIFDGTGRHAIYHRGASAWSMYAGASEFGSTAANTNAHVLSCVFNNTSSGIWIDGVSGADANFPGTSGWTGTGYLGQNVVAAQRWDGWIAMILFYHSALITADRQTVEAGLKAQWGTP